MTAYTVPAIGDKVRNVYTGREFVVTRLDLIDLEQGGGPEMWAHVKGDRGENDVWQGKVTAFEPVDDVIDAEVVEEPADRAHDPKPHYGEAEHAEGRRWCDPHAAYCLR